MTIQSREIKMNSGERTTRAHLAAPEGTGPWPGVVVVQEWWGLNDHIRSIADRFTMEGFVALAPDLYFGEEAHEPDDARKLAMALQWSEALGVIQSAIDTLIGQPEVEPKKIGLTGFCMGGGLAWHGAAKLSGLGAVVPFYGGGPEMTVDDAKQINVPVLAIYGELDQGVSPAVAGQRAALMDEAGATHETIIYPNAKHGFFNDTRPSNYNPEASADAWQRMINLFRANLV